MKQIKTFISLTAVLCLLLSLVPAAHADGEADERFRDKTWEQVIEDFMTEYNAVPERVAIGYYNTVTGEEHYHRGDEYMVAASMYKVPLNMLFTDWVSSGEIDWDTTIGGIDYTRALEWTIINSDNDMAERMWNYAGGYRTYRELICPYMGVDPETADAMYWKNNYFTAEQMIHCLRMLYENPDRFPRVVDTMLRAEPGKYFKLRETDFDIAQKYGYLADDWHLYLNDCAICYTDDPFCLVLFTDSISNPYAFMADLCTLMCDYTQYHTALRHEEEARAAEEAAILSLNSGSGVKTDSTPLREAASAVVVSAVADTGVDGGALLSLALIAVILVFSALAFASALRAGRCGKVKSGWAVATVVLATLALMVCAAAPNLGTLLSSPTGDPQAAVTAFFDALAAGDYSEAYALLDDYSSLGLENEPGSEAGRQVYDALRQSYSYKLYGDCRVDQLSARQQVLLQYLDLRRLEEDLPDATDAALSKLVSSLPADEVYDADGGYLPALTETAYANAVSTLLEHPEKYVTTAGLELELVYRDGGWQIVSNSALLSAVSGGTA